MWTFIPEVHPPDMDVTNLDVQVGVTSVTHVLIQEATFISWPQSKTERH